MFFTQALHNVVQNSIDAMPGGGTLKVATKRQESKLEVTVADTGAGIPQEEVPLVFMPFYSTKEGGSGLGLTISYNIIAAHGGSLDLVANHAQGACFRVFLPTGERI